MSPLISILIPCYNAERYIAAAIQSALSQDYPSIEVLVVDDGSTDGSREIIRSFEAAPNFRWETGSNRGGNAARNRLLAIARGEFIQYLDADDLLHPDKLSKCMAAMTDDVDMVFCDYIERTGKQQRRVTFSSGIGDIVEYFVSSGVQTSIPLHRTQVLRSSGGFDESLRCCQEYEFHLRLAWRHWRKVVHLPEALCTVVKVEGSVSSNEARVFAQMAGVLDTCQLELKAQDALTPTRANAIATQLHICCRHLARHGLDESANTAYALAKRLSPTTPLPARWPVRALSGLIGPVRAEHLSESLRKIMR